MDTHPQISDSLHRSEVFKGLTSEQFTGLLKKGRRIKLQPKRILFNQGDPADSCFLVNRGRLKLTKLNEQGKEVILRFIMTGELTAAIAVLRNWTYPVTAESIEETDITGWDKPTMVQLMRRYPDIAINLLGIILARIDDVQHRYLEVCTEHVSQRIARSLLRLMRRAGSKTPEGIRIDHPFKPTKYRRPLAERSNAAKGQFIATISHEVRTPLHGILGLTRMLQADAADEAAAAAETPISPAQRRRRAERLRTLERSGEHLLTIINDVLDHNRIEGGPAAVRRALRADFARGRSGETAARLGAGKGPVPVLAGRHALAALGARRRRPAAPGAAQPARQRGEVHRAWRHRPARGVHAEGLMRLEVSDSGPGVPKAERERIFQPFEQLDGSFSRRHGGTGLGLSISRQLARAMQGDIECGTSIAGGALFRLRLVLPACDAPAGAITSTSAGWPIGTAASASTGAPAGPPAAAARNAPVNAPATALATASAGAYADNPAWCPRIGHQPIGHHLHRAGAMSMGAPLPVDVFNTLTIPLVYVLGRRLFPGTPSRRSLAPVLAAIIFAISPLMVYYSQEARMYTLLIFEATLASYLLLKILQSTGPTSRLTLPLLYALTAAAALYTHYFALFLLMAHALYALFMLWQQRWPARLLSQLSVMVGLTALLFAPWLPTLLARLGDDPSYWPGALKLDEAIRKVLISFTVGETVFEETGFWLALGYLLIFGVCTLWAIINLRLDPPTSSATTSDSPTRPLFAIPNSQHLHLAQAQVLTIHCCSSCSGCFCRRS